MKTIDVFLRQYGCINCGLIDVPRQRRLHEDAMDFRVCVEPGDQTNQVRFRSGFRKHARERSDSEPGAHPFLHPHVNSRGRVFPHAHKREARLDAALLQHRTAAGGFGVDLFGDGTPVNEIGQRHQGSSRIDSTSMIGVLTQRWSMSSSPMTMTFLPANFLRLMSSLSLWR